MNENRARIHALIDAIDLAWEQNASEKAAMLTRELEELERQEKEDKKNQSSLLMFPTLADFERGFFNDAPIVL